MAIFRTRAVWLLAALLLVLTACAKESPPEKSEATLEGVRQQVSAAFDGTASSAERRLAADEAMRLLLELLRQPDSLVIAEEDWSAPPRPGVESMVYHLELSGDVHLYALSLPGKSLVEELHRVAVQVRGADAPQAFELSPLPGGRVEAARVSSEAGQLLITLALRSAEDEGYVAHFAGVSGGPLELVADAFAGMVGQFGAVVLEPQEGFLHVSVEEGRWAPLFDPDRPHRLQLAPEVFLDWEQRFVLVNDARFDAFRLVAIAEDPTRWCKQEGDCPEAVHSLLSQDPRQAAEVAWNLAADRLTRLLAEEPSWSAEFTDRLPAGSRSLREEGRDLSVRLLSVPAPEELGTGAYNAVQFRTGGGVPMTRALDLPGLVEAYRVMAHNGNPALFLVVDEPADAAGTMRSKSLHLLRLDAGNDWRPAEGWVGFVPEAPYWNLTAVSPNSVTISWDTAALPGFALELEEGPEPRLSICRQPSDCHHLTWIDGSLHSLPILSHYLAETQRVHADGELEWFAGQLAEFLQRIDPAELPGPRLVELLDPDGFLGIAVIEAGENTRLVALPQSPTGVQMAVIHAPGQALLVTTYDGIVSRWEGAQIVQGGDQKRLLLLGRSEKAAVLLAHQWADGVWIPVDALEGTVDRVVRTSVRLMHLPGATRPARGIIALGGPRLTAVLTASGALLCEDRTACVTYGYDGGWQLK